MASSFAFGETAPAGVKKNPAVPNAAYAPDYDFRADVGAAAAAGDGVGVGVGVVDGAGAGAEVEPYRVLDNAAAVAFQSRRAELLLVRPLAVVHVV